MASSATIGATLSRLSVHFRITRTEEETAVVLRDWVRALEHFDDEVVRCAADDWLLREEWLPTLTGIIDACQAEARRVAGVRADALGLPRFPSKEETADAHAHAAKIRAAWGLSPRDPDSKLRRHFDGRR